MPLTIAEGEPLVLHLEFPAEWPQPRNPLAEPAAAWARTFLTDFGFPHHPAAARQLERLNIASYAWPFFAADRQVLCTVTAFLSLWALYEEEIAAVGEDDEAALICAVRGDGTRPLNRFHAAFWELGQRYYKRLGRTFLSRHGERFRAWLQTARAGYGDRAAATLPILDFLELDLGEELGSELWRDPRLATVERLAAEVIALQDDLASFLRQPEDARPNAVRRLQEEEGENPAEACIRIALRHNGLVRDLDRTGRALIADHRVPRLGSWWIRLAGLVAGFGRRHADRGCGPASIGGRRIRLTHEEPSGGNSYDPSAITTATWWRPTSMSALSASA